MEFNKLDIKNKVTQSNDLVVAQYKLSPNEQKVILLLISLIQPNDTNLKSYKLRVKDLADIL
ncbi:MAG: RepB family plasmid replication initiator protein [Candidatus Electrothrix sp. GM3_4]|nr:RepB family plasmid replication initiator protein [Candidatus Electrothrix sp. GM3_4]